jgi:hypothetical protein
MKFSSTIVEKQAPQGFASGSSAGSDLGHGQNGEISGI